MKEAEWVIGICSQVTSKESNSRDIEKKNEESSVLLHDNTFAGSVRVFSEEIIGTILGAEDFVFRLVWM